MYISKLNRDEYIALVKALPSDIKLPIQQDPLWKEVEVEQPGREFWGFLRFDEQELNSRERTHTQPIAFMSLLDYQTHGFHSLRSTFGPVWLAEPSREREEQLLDSLVRYLKKHAKNQVFLRCSSEFEHSFTYPTLSTISYDSTVIIDLEQHDEIVHTGKQNKGKQQSEIDYLGQEDLLTPMKKRGRHDIRKGLRNYTPEQFKNEYAIAAQSFANHYEVMEVTGKRDNFTPPTMADIEALIHIFGSERCLVMTARNTEGTIQAWQLILLCAPHAYYLYGASTSEARAHHMVDALMYNSCVELRKHGCIDFDLMGIGSEFCPELNTLNQFKTKFSEKITHKAPNRDLPLRPFMYKLLTRIQKLRGR